MKIYVKDYGIINEATIDLSKKLTLFCGGNGTGKTYMSYLAYSALSQRLGRMFMSSLKELTKSNLQTFLKTNKYKHEISLAYLLNVEEKIAHQTAINIDELFGLSDEDAEKMFDSTRISFIDDKEELKSRVFNCELNVTRTLGGSVWHVIKSSNEMEVLISCETTENKIINMDIEEALHWIRLMLVEFYTMLVRFPITESFILPVERNSIYTFTKELSLSRNNLIDEILDLPSKRDFNPFDYVQKASKRYPLAIKDAINIANDLVTLKKHKGEYFELASEIEKQLLGGTIDVTGEGDVVYYSNLATSKKNGKLPIHMTASLVKTLASFIFFLKYQAKKGQLIIIDEPEMNFHPDSQIIFVSLIAKLLNNGLRFLISTHSDYIIREFNKLIMLDAVRKLHPTQHNLYRDVVSISHQDINAYFYHFKSTRSKKVVVDLLPIDVDGICVPSIDSVIEAQNQILDELSYKLHYPEL